MNITLVSPFPHNIFLNNENIIHIYNDIIIYRYAGVSIYVSKFEEWNIDNLIEYYSGNRKFSCSNLFYINQTNLTPDEIEEIKTYITFM